MDRQEAEKLIKEADIDAARQVVILVADELDALAAQVWAFGLSEGPRRAMAIVAQMGAELAVGASQLYSMERWYAGAALVRQLIEVEYLLFLFVLDPGAPNRWLNASSEEIRLMFSPKEMRARSGGRFRAEEYSAHCEMGGHPRSKGHVLLREHNLLTEHVFVPEIQWVDLAQHIERLWVHYVASVSLHSPKNVYPEKFRSIGEQLKRWRDADPLPSRI